MRVHDRRLPGVDAEEARVEFVDVVQDRRGLDVARLGHVGGGDPRRDQLFVGEEGDRLDPRAQIAPEVREIFSPREAPRHSDDGDSLQGERRLIAHRWSSLGAVAADAR